jgi:hypothetical protein
MPYQPRPSGGNPKPFYGHDGGGRRDRFFR